MEQKIDMVQELYKIALDWLRRQASQVILLSIGIVSIYTLGTEQIAKLEGKIAKQEEKIDAQADEIRKCDMERASLQVEVNALKIQLEMAFPRLNFSRKKNLSNG